MSETELMEKIRILNADPAINGILVQLPLPEQFQSHAAIMPLIRLKTSMDSIQEH